MDEQINYLYKLTRCKDSVITSCESIQNYKSYLDYNFFFVNKMIDEKFEELSKTLIDLKKEIRLSIKEKYQSFVRTK
jgi:hypothetical protein